MLHLDGSTLEGGGQLVRNAVAISALTGRPIEVTRIRGNRSGKQGLKGSHHAAINFLLEVCGGVAEKNQVGSTRVVFYPRGEQQREEEISKSKSKLKGKGKNVVEKDGETPDLSSLSLEEVQPPSIPIQPEYTIKLSTPGSVFLIFQALYPYLLYAGATAEVVEPIRLNITGGTNASFSPSYDYVSQVLVPNFSKLGLPPLSVRLQKRGWASGRIELGAVSFLITPLPRPMFPVIDLNRYERGYITKIEVTILAPDTPVRQQTSSSSGYKRGSKASRGKGKKGRALNSDYDPYNDPLEEVQDEYQDESEEEEGEEEEKGRRTETTRQFIERYTLKSLSKAIKPHLQRNEQDNDGSTQPTEPVINIHTSESTYHYSHTYLLLVAHTSTGFRLGRDALYSSFSDRSAETGLKGKKERTKNHSKGKSRGKDSVRARDGGREGGDGGEKIRAMVTQCVRDLMEELDLESGTEKEREGNRNRYLDVFMRDQIVVFQALGMKDNANSLVESAMKPGDVETEGGLSLHSRTAMWVCEQMLGVSF